MQGIPERIDSKFRFVLLASHRAEQLMRGAELKLAVPGKITRAAMEEVMQDAIAWDYGAAEGDAAAVADGEAEDTALKIDGEAV